MNHRTHDGTEQGVFNAVTLHLFEQGRQSLVEGSTSSCAYRGTDGRSCAIGCMIPDDRYRQKFEGLSAYHSDVRKAAGLNPKNEILMEPAVELQRAHDGSFSVDVNGAFRRDVLNKELEGIAERFGLTMPEIPAAPSA